MSKVIAVIGAGYGDEGKGLMTDYFSSQYDNAVVIRSNGGAQAGHTVVTPEGQRHVFSHFGSGTFNGTPTYLSSHFVCNPTLFVKEHKAFVKEFGIVPRIYIDQNCLITTPYDMLLNQTHEAMRGGDWHGSCGVGFGETLEREMVYGTITVWDLIYYDGDDILKSDLHDIRNEYVPSRIDLNKLSNNFIEILNSEKLVDDFKEACDYMIEHTVIAMPDSFTNNTLIFEAAQGLLLDMDYGYFPHVTRSNCGMKNISEILTHIPGVHDITVNYVRRAYTTRHGAGPLEGELSLANLGHNVVDKTNITNDFQGTLRFANANFDLFESITDKDFLNYAWRGAKKTTTMTCIDQLGKCTGTMPSSDVNNLRSMYWTEDFVDMASRVSDYLSYGQTREDIIMKR